MAKTKPARERAVSILERGLKEAKKILESGDTSSASAQAMTENIANQSRRMLIYLERGLIDPETADRMNKEYLRIEEKFYGEYGKTHSTLLNDIPISNRN